MLEKIFFITNWNLYETKRLFTAKLAEALNRQGIETEIFDIQENSLKAVDMSSLLQFRPDLICTFHSIDPLPGKNKYFYDIIRTPCLSILLDPFLYSLKLLSSPYSIISCVDKFDCQAFTSSHFENVFFLPHAVDKEVEMGNDERIYDVTFLGSCTDFESIRNQWRSKYSAEQNKIMDDAIDLILSDKFIPIAQALSMSINAAQIPLEKVDTHQMFYNLDFYTRGRDRVELIRSIKHANVHIFGEIVQHDAVNRNGWGYYLGDMKNVHLHGSLPYNETFEVMRKSKICLNSMPFFKNGSHERIFNSLACGALPITSNSLYIQEEFKIGKELVVYQPSRWEEANTQIDHFLRNEPLRKEIVKLGREKVMKDHTWDNRATELIAGVSPILEKMLQKK